MFPMRSAAHIRGLEPLLIRRLACCALRLVQEARVAREGSSESHLIGRFAKPQTENGVMIGHLAELSWL